MRYGVITDIGSIRSRNGISISVYIDSSTINPAPMYIFYTINTLSMIKRKISFYLEKYECV